MRVKRFSAVSEFVELFCASGLWKCLIEVMLGMSSPQLALHIVNKGIFSGIISNKDGKWEHGCKNSVSWLLNFEVGAALQTATSVQLSNCVKGQQAQFEAWYNGWAKLKYLGLNAGHVLNNKDLLKGACVYV